MSKIGLTDLLPQPQGPTVAIVSLIAHHAQKSIDFKRAAKTFFAADVTTRDYYFNIATAAWRDGAAVGTSVRAILGNGRGRYANVHWEHVVMSSRLLTT